VSVTVSAVLYDDQHAELVALAAAGDRTLSGEIRRAVRIYLDALHSNDRPERPPIPPGQLTILG
jgi:hypothetical protein